MEDEGAKTSTAGPAGEERRVRATWNFGVPLISIALIFILLLTVGMMSQMMNLLGGLVVTELCILVAALLPAGLLASKLGEELGIVPERGPVGVVIDLGAGMVWGLMSLVAGIPVIILWLTLLPPPPSYYEAMRRALTPSTPAELGVWLLLMVMVGFCEEILGRGVIQQGAENQFGRRPGLLLASAIFAGLHLDPYRFGPLFVISLIWGWRFQRSHYSLYVSWAAHTTNNSVAILILYLYQTFL